MEKLEVVELRWKSEDGIVEVCGWMRRSSWREVYKGGCITATCEYRKTMETSLSSFLSEIHSLFHLICLVVRDFVCRHAIHLHHST